MNATRIAGIAGVFLVTVLGSAARAAGPSPPARGVPGAPPSTLPSQPAGGVIGSLTVVTAEQIAATAAPDVRAALALAPSLVIDDTGGPAGLVSLSLRGSSARQVLVLVDGHRVGHAPSGPFNLNDLAVRVERIVRIEVIPAPVSVIYGSDAIGGVVNIVTQPAGVSPGLAVSYGRGAEAEQRIAGGVQYGFKNVGLRLDAQLLTGDGFRDNGDHEQSSFAVGLAVAPAPWGLDLRWTALKREAGVAGPLAGPSAEARRKDVADGLRADLVYLPKSNWNLQAGVFTRSRSLRFTDPAPPSIDPLVPSSPIAVRLENSSSGVDARLEVDTKRGELYSVGAEWVDDRVTGDTDEDRSEERWSLSAQDQWRNGAWSAVLALRRDQHSVYGGRSQPSVSVGWESGGWKLWTTWAKANRIPSFEERYLDEQFRKGNPELKAETSTGFDGGIEAGGAAGRVRISAFRRSVDNLIGWTGRDGDYVSRPENVAQATTSGWEAEVLYRPSAAIAIPVGYQQLSTQNEATRASLAGAVRSIWRAAIQGTGKSLSWSLEYTVTDRGEFQRRDESWSYTVVNAALAWRDTLFSLPVQVGLRIENLQDRNYETVEGYPMRGRSWFAEVKVGL